MHDTKQPTWDLLTSEAILRKVTPIRKDGVAIAILILQSGGPCSQVEDRNEQSGAAMRLSSSDTRSRPGKRTDRLLESGDSPDLNPPWPGSGVRQHVNRGPDLSSLGTRRGGVPRIGTCTWYLPHPPPCLRPVPGPRSCCSWSARQRSYGQHSPLHQQQLPPHETQRAMQPCRLLTGRACWACGWV